jgi:D-alanyl-D-alanine carboxypeptidase/D-alanyl-D-alanine-endopeptidase (penicillin-binding protein 4)
VTPAARLTVVAQPFRAASIIVALTLSSACAAKAQVQHQPNSRPVQELRRDLGRVFGAPVMARGVWGVDIRSLDTGERLYELNAGKLMMPASNMKIVTLAVAAETLGWDFRFTTTLESGAPVEDGVLHGDLFIRGNGDPTINTRDGRGEAILSEWAEALRAAGIREIRGRIVGDDQAFDEQGIGPGWSWDYLEAGYAAPSGALQFNEDTAALTIAPSAVEGEPAILRLPPGTGLALVSRAVTGPAGSETTIAYSRRIDGPVVEVTGSIPLGGEEIRRNVAVANPTLYLAQALKAALVARGIPVTGDAADQDDIAAELLASVGAERRVLATTTSPPLREIATVLMKVSQNLYAETLLKAVGAARHGLGTTQGGRAVVRETLTAWGIPADSYVNADGSGLSRYNYLAPNMVTAVLERMHRDPKHRDAFVATLPIAGKDGTISTRMRRTRAEANAVAKTGSIANVRSLSGFVRTRDGEVLVFSIVANDFVVPASTVTWIADLAVEILSNFTRR